MTNEKRLALHAEWQAWQNVCEQLYKLGAVTKDDLEASQNRNDTPGQRLLNAVRAWGDRVRELKEATKGE